LLGLIESLQSTIRKLIWKPAGTEWADIMRQITTKTQLSNTRKFCDGLVVKNRAKKVWDLGAKTQVFFSRVAVETGAY